MTIQTDADINDTNENLDVLIVGAGPIGLACGIEAKKRDLSYRIIEKGCLVNSIYNFPVNMTFFSTSERIEIGNVPFISHGDKPTRREALEYYRRVKLAWNLEINSYEKVTDIKKQEDGYFKIITEKNRYRSKSVVIATGYYDTANRLDIPGEDLDKVSHYFKEPHPYAEQRVIVVGGGNSAVDIALECFRRGSAVTLVVREPTLKGSIKYWVKPDIENRIKEGSIPVYYNTVLKEIREKEADLQTETGVITIGNDFVLAMTGYQPDFPFLTKTGIGFLEDEDRTPRMNPDTYETNVTDLYLAGVVCGGMNTSRWFIENGIDHAEKVFNHIMKKKS
ncbi:MAG: YpdA family putative bacillithiol disulfide reductase [bacterium]|nr:YpdA family putative bacillithiol disulfide reductase [bacterium]